MGHPDKGTPTTTPAPVPAPASQVAKETTHYIFGPQTEVPENIIDTLQKWHNTPRPETTMLLPRPTIGEMAIQSL